MCVDDVSEYWTYCDEQREARAREEWAKQCREALGPDYEWEEDLVDEDEPEEWELDAVNAELDLAAVEREEETVAVA